MKVKRMTNRAGKRKHREQAKYGWFVVVGFFLLLFFFGGSGYEDCLFAPTPPPQEILFHDLDDSEWNNLGSPKKKYIYKQMGNY